MNPRLEKVIMEIEKLKRKITDYQSRLREMERQKTEIENAEIVAIVRSVDIPPEEFQELLSAIKEKRDKSLPDSAIPTVSLPKVTKKDETGES